LANETATQLFKAGVLWRQFSRIIFLKFYWYILVVDLNLDEVYQFHLCFIVTLYCTPGRYGYLQPRSVFCCIQLFWKSAHLFWRALLSPLSERYSTKLHIRRWTASSSKQHRMIVHLCARFASTVYSNKQAIFSNFFPPVLQAASRI